MENNFKDEKWQVVDNFGSFEEYSQEEPQIYIWDGDEAAHSYIAAMPQMGEMNYIECLSNAHLIASAPDLLNALTEIVNTLDGPGTINTIWLRDFCQAAINKALK